MTCYVDGCWGDCSTHNPALPELGSITGFKYIPTIFSKQAPTSKDVGVLPAINVAFKQYVSKYSDLTFPVCFLDWVSDPFSMGINGGLYTQIWILESIEDSWATYIPHICTATTTITLEEIQLISSFHSGALQLLAEQFKQTIGALKAAVDDYISGLVSTPVVPPGIPTYLFDQDAKGAMYKHKILW